MTNFKYLILLPIVYLAGCAHPIEISARTDHLPSANSPIIEKNVGYYISEADRNEEVVGPGGGGDKISYKPYPDLETGIYKVLLNIYKNVVKLPSIDKAEIEKNKISYVFIPKLVTNSSSTGYFTWPATDFEIELTMQARDSNGTTLWSKVITAKGHAEYDEFKHDLQLSSRRASEELLSKLQKEIISAEKLH